MSTDRNFGLISNAAWKNPCLVATTSAILLDGLQVIDDVSVVAGDRVLVKDQGSADENGIYVVDTGLWQRPADADGQFDFVIGTLMRVRSGTVNAGFWEITDQGVAAPIPGTDSIVPGLASAALAIVSGYIQGLLNDATASEARTTLGLNAGGAGDIWLEKAGDTATGTMVFSSTIQVKDTANFRIVYASNLTQVLLPQCSAIAPNTTRNWHAIDEDFVLGQGYEFPNLTGSASVSASALTIRLRDKRANDISNTSLSQIKYRNSTQSSGTYNLRQQSSALSMVISNGSTLGTQSAIAARIYFGTADSAGGNVMFAYNPYNATDGTLRPLDESKLYSSTAEGGAGAADSAQVLYSTAAFTDCQIRVIGYLEITQATAGAWVTGHTKCHMLQIGDPRTGTVIQDPIVNFTAVNSSTVITSASSNSVTSTQGTSLIGATITPTWPGNLLDVQAVMQLANNTTDPFVAALHTTQNTSAIAAVKGGFNVANECRGYGLAARIVAGTTLAMTITGRAGPVVAATLALNGDTTAAALFNGAANSYIRIREIFR
jgi:hypothetical protein